MTIDLDLLSTAIPQQLAIVGGNGLLEYANAAFRSCFNVSLEQLVGLRLDQVLGSGLAAEYAPMLERAMQGEAAEILHAFPHPHEGRAWKTSFVPRPEGGCLFVSENPGIPDLHPTRVSKVDHRLQAFVDFAPIGMIFSHLDGRVLEANNAFLDLIGYTREELDRGEIHWDTMTPPEYLHLDQEAIAEAKQTGFSRSYEKEYVKKSGDRVHILLGFILVGPTRDEAVAFIVDLTAQKQVEEEVLRLNAELEERVATRTAELELANRELEAFCYSVSHDLRAPLRSIDGFAYALYQDYADKFDEEGLDFIERIRGSAKRMDELISALLALSRLTRLELERENIDFSELAELAAAEMRHQHEDREIEVVVQPDLSVRADKRMLRVVIDNLFGNALKFTAKTPNARIEFGQDSGTGAFYVHDNGVGFNMDDSAKLFQPFERLHSPRDFSGSGIGLATVQRIIRKHGGRIWAQSEVDKGATFFFTL